MIVSRGPHHDLLRSWPMMLVRWSSLVDSTALLKGAHERRGQDMVPV
jgi:hypothetical protein